MSGVRRTLRRLFANDEALKYMAYALLAVGLVLEVVNVEFLFTNPGGIMLMCAGSFCGGIRWARRDAGPRTEDPPEASGAGKRAWTILLILVVTAAVFAGFGRD